MTTRSFEGKSPQVGNHVFIDPTALVIGQVTLGEDSSVWPMTVIRGDINAIEIGRCSNIQDGTIIHVTHAGDYCPTGFPTRVGNYVTVGHQAMLHACTIEDYVLVGMNAILLDGCHIPTEVVIGAGSLVPPSKHLESGYFYVGSPVKRVRELTAQEKEFLRYSANYYVELKNRHLQDGGMYDR